MKNVNRIYVVGNKFNYIATHQQIITLQDLEQHIDMALIGQEIGEFREYVITQGVSQYDIDKLMTIVRDNHLSNIVVKPSVTSYVEDQTKVHKHNIENVLISTPIKKDDKKYLSFLMIDDKCAELSDHITGRHLPGMLLLESARQMMTAVMENFFLEKDEKFYFILNHIDISFHQFVFPFDVILEYEIIDLNKLNDFGIKSSAVIHFTQSGKEVCKVKIDFSIYMKKMVESMELRMIKDILNKDIKKDVHIN